LTHQEIKWEWTLECEKSFQKLKKRLTIVSVLALPLGIEGFMVYSDTSNRGLGHTLMQHGRIIAYTSKQLKLHKVNYPIHDLELAAVVFTLQVWMHYLCGSQV
jgi:hypothetical protein